MLPEGDNDEMTMIIEIPHDTAGHDAAVDAYFHPRRERRPASVRTVERWADIAVGVLLTVAALVTLGALFGLPVPWYIEKVSEIGLGLYGGFYGVGLAVAGWRSGATRAAGGEQ